MFCCCRKTNGGEDHDAAEAVAVYDAAQFLDAANNGKDAAVRSMLSAKNADANFVRASDGASALYLASTEASDPCPLIPPTQPIPHLQWHLVDTHTPHICIMW